MFLAATEKDFSAVPWPEPLPIEPPTSDYWQNDKPPFNVVRLPNRFPGPRGFHYLDFQVGVKAYERQEQGEELELLRGPMFAPLPGADGIEPILSGQLPTQKTRPPSPVPAVRVALPPVKDRRTVGEPRKPRLPRPPRPPRKPRAARDPRYPRISRRPRPNRVQRKDRKARPPRPPRKPRFNGLKGERWGTWCHMWIGEGTHNRSGELYGFPPGTAPPPSGKDWVWLPVPPTLNGCGDMAKCNGPLAPFFRKLVSWFGIEQRPRLSPEQIAYAKKSEEKARKRAYYERIQQVDTAAPITTAKSTYCCICGATGGCFTSVGDCRQANVLQRSKGEC